MSITSPDITPYLPLAPFGRTSTEIAVAALQDMAAKLPGVTLVEAMTEVGLIETLAVTVGDLGLAVDRVPAVVFEVVLRQFDVVRDGGGRATVTLEFTANDTAGHTIPAGTEVVLDVADSTVVFATDVPLVIPALSSTGIVGATATIIGSTPNGVAVGTAVRVRSGGVSFVQGATLATEPANGRDPELDETYFARVGQRFARLTEALVLPSHFEAFALEDPLVYRALVIDLYDSVGGPPYTDTGHLTVVARGASGNLTTAQKTSLRDAMESAAVAGMIVHVLDPTVTTVNVAATVTKTSTAVSATVEAAAEAAVTAFLNPATWPWDATVRLSDIIGILEGIAGVDFVNVTSVLLNGSNADLAIAGDGPLATAGTITVTVV